jgi:hypothetical protein
LQKLPLALKILLDFFSYEAIKTVEVYFMRHTCPLATRIVVSLFLCYNNTEKYKIQLATVKSIYVLKKVSHPAKRRRKP